MVAIKTPSATRLMLMLVLVVLLGGMVGCQNNQVTADRDALMAQNRELQNRLTQTQAALDAAESDRSRLVGEVNRLQGDLASARTAPPPPAATPAPAPAAANTGFSTIAGVETVATRDAITVRVPGDVLFESGKVDLRQQAQKTLSDIARVIQREYPNNIVRIEGYTDTDPIRRSKWKDNLELSLQRAAAVHRHLTSQGISADRLYAAGFGETRPRGNKAQSRRVEIVVVLETD